MSIIKRALLSKIQEVEVTEANIHYKGSIKLCPDLMKKAGLEEWQEVEVNGKNTMSRIKTYVIKGEKGDCELNGGAANYFDKGDLVHINAYGLVDDLSNHKPIIC